MDSGRMALMQNNSWLATRILAPIDSHSKSQSVFLCHKLEFFSFYFLLVYKTASHVCAASLKHIFKA